MKTPEELAEEYADYHVVKGIDYIRIHCKGTINQVKNGFLAGYQAGYDRGYERAVEVLHMTYKTAAPQWISVKDRLPEENQGWVTVYAANTGWRWMVQPGFYNANTKTWLSRFLADESNYATFDLVTHWMPLPKPPEK